MLYFKKAERLYEQLHFDNEKARIYYYYAFNEQRTGNIANALELLYTIESIHLLNEDSLNQAKVLDRMGSVYSDLNNYEKSLEVYKKSIEIYKSYHKQSRLPSVYVNIAEVYIKLEEYETAKSYIYNALKIVEKSDNLVRITDIKLSLLEIYIQEKKYNSALSLLNEALPVYKKLNYTPGVANLFFGKARIHSYMYQNKRALECIDSALFYAKQTSSIHTLKNAYLLESEIFEANKQFENSLKSFKKYKEYSDSVLNEDALLKAEQIKSKYELKEKENEIHQLQSKTKLKQRQLQLSFGIFAVIILSLVIIFLLLRARDKTKHLKILADKNIELEKSNKFRKNLINNVMHEVRTPLNVIVGLTEFSSRNKALKNDFIESIRESSDNLTRMIDSMILISSLESGSIKTDLRKTDLLELQNRIKQYLNDSLNKNKIEYQLNSDDDLTIITDENILFEIIKRLLDNSFKYTESGYIRIYFNRFNNLLKISIKDTGIGINKTNMNYIFNLFSKVEFEHKIYRGVGLGLPIAKGLTNLIQGSLNAESKPGVGSEFTVSLPLKPHL
jgi:signal transduction histidine kinase